MKPQELKRARQALGLTQYGLAERLKTTRNTVARWERGELPIAHITGLAVQHLLLIEKTGKGGKKKK